MSVVSVLRQVLDAIEMGMEIVSFVDTGAEAERLAKEGRYREAQDKIERWTVDNVNEEIEKANPWYSIRRLPELLEWLEAQKAHEASMVNLAMEDQEETSTSYQWSEKEELLLPYPGRETSEDCYREDDTEIIQRQLGKHGFHVTVDGNYGAKTKEAVYLFQTQKSLVNDGVVGANTWSALFFWKV